MANDCIKFDRSPIFIRDETNVNMCCARFEGGSVTILLEKPGMDSIVILLTPEERVRLAEYMA